MSCISDNFTMIDDGALRKSLLTEELIFIVVSDKLRENLLPTNSRIVEMYSYMNIRCVEYFFCFFWYTGEFFFSLFK
jgi:hypothetical protein